MLCSCQGSSKYESIRPGAVEMKNSDIEQDSKTPYPSRSLRVVHILLISSGAALAFGFAVLKFFQEAPTMEVLGITWAGVALSLYLRSFIRRTS